MNQKLQGVLILVVEDETDLRETMAEGLEVFGATVLRAASGNQALEMISKTPVDFVISDIRMPDGDGIGLLKALRERDPVTPTFFFLSGFSDLSPDEAIAMGAQGFLYKPIGTATLAQAVANILFSMAGKKR